MPSALLRACPGGCGALVQKGRCPACARAKEQQRIANRGHDLYNSVRWRTLRSRFRRALQAAGVYLACGARLPGAPATTDSQCAADGVIVSDSLHRAMTGRSLHVDHIRRHEGDERLFADMLNLQLLCATDHNRKSQREGR